jgi:hypothetical protein
MSMANLHQMLTRSSQPQPAGKIIETMYEFYDQVP